MCVCVFVHHLCAITIHHVWANAAILMSLCCFYSCRESPLRNRLTFTWDDLHKPHGFKQLVSHVEFNNRLAAGESRFHPAGSQFYSVCTGLTAWKKNCLQHSEPKVANACNTASTPQKNHLNGDYRGWNKRHSLQDLSDSKDVITICSMPPLILQPCLIPSTVHIKDPRQTKVFIGRWSDRCIIFHGPSNK